MLSRLLYKNIEPDTARWVAIVGNSRYDRGYGISTDSSGNAYIVGFTDKAVYDYTILTAKYNTEGTLQWQRGLTVTDSDNPRDISVDSIDNVYIVGTTSVASYLRAIIAKYNTNGILQWQRSLGNNTSYSYGQGISVDPSGNVYIVGRTRVVTGNYDANLYIAKYNTNGILQWQRLLVGTGEDNSRSISVDSSGNVYIAGSAGSNSVILIAKYNTNGTLQWQRQLSVVSNAYQDISVDPNGNVYIVGSPYIANSGTGTKVLIAKYNTNGTLQWQRLLGSTTAYVYGRGISVAPDGNVYIVGSTTTPPSKADVLIVKYSTNGILQWQRSLGSSSGEEGESISVDPSGNVCIVGKTFNESTTYDNIFIAKCGDSTGLIGSFTYNTTTLSESVATFTDAAATFTDAAATFTDAAATLSDSAITLPSTITKA